MTPAETLDALIDALTPRRDPEAAVALSAEDRDVALWGSEPHVR